MQYNCLLRKIQLIKNGKKKPTERAAALGIIRQNSQMITYEKGNSE